VLVDIEQCPLNIDDRKPQSTLDSVFIHWILLVGIPSLFDPFLDWSFVAALLAASIGDPSLLIRQRMEGQTWNSHQLHLYHVHAVRDSDGASAFKIHDFNSGKSCSSSNTKTHRPQLSSQLTSSSSNH
jgi:hypothetical protein